MHTRPGAIDFLRCALKKSPRSCTLGIFADSDAWLVQLCETNVTEIEHVQGEVWFALCQAF